MAFLDLSRRRMLALLACGGCAGVATMARASAALADGSRWWRAPGTDADADVDGPLRRIVLRSGAVCIAPSGLRRPFVIDVPQGRVHAAGACCVLRLDGATCAVAALAGRVDIVPARGPTCPMPPRTRAQFDAVRVRL